MATWRLPTDCMVRVLSPDKGQEIYLFSERPDGLCDPGLKRPGRELDHSFPSNAEVKDELQLHLYSPIYHGEPYFIFKIPCST